MQLSVNVNKKGTKIKAIGKRKENLKALLYLLPALVSIAVLFLVPVVWTIILSFTNKDLYHMDNYHFIGFSNYAKMLTGDLKPIFFPIFVWTVIFALITTLGGYLLGLIYALLLNNKKMKERNIYKSLLIIPWALPATIATLAWQGLLNEDYGGINLLLKNLHLTSASIHWLTNPTLARIAILFVSIWFTFPYMMNVCLGALQAIPDDYYEAADIDGASRWKKFVKITLPSLASSSYPLIISSFAFNFNNFGAAYLITRGNPPRLDTPFAGQTDILASAAYKMTSQFYKYGYAGAIAVMLFVLVAGISLINMIISGQFKEVD